MQPIWRGAVVVAICIALTGASAAATFSFGITPSQADKGVQEPGTKFFTSFKVVSGQEEQLDVTIDTTTAGVDAFQQLKPAAARNFSEQRCDGCVEFQHEAGGPLQDYSKDGSINQWKQVEFFVNVPEDAEPGYHMLNVKPQPVKASGSGSVGVVSAATFPVIFRVPGKAVRSVRLLGVHAGRTTDDRQHIVATLYNDGTVTVSTRTRIRVPTADGNTTIRAGTRRLAPGETATVTGRIATDRLQVRNGTYPAHATVDYTTGKDTFSSQLSVREPAETTTTQAVTQPTPSDKPSYLSYIVLVLVLAVTTVTTWKVVQHARY